MGRVVFFLLASFVSMAYGQIVNMGPCLPIPAQSPITLPDIAGKYYLALSTENDAERTGRCHTIVFEFNKDTSTVTVTKKQLYDTTKNGGEKITIGTGKYDPTIGKFKVAFPGSTIEYTVIKFVPTQSLAFYGTEKRLFSCAKYLWFYSTQRFPTSSVIEGGSKLFSFQKFTSNLFNKTSQLACPPTY